MSVLVTATAQMAQGLVCGPLRYSAALLLLKRRKKSRDWRYQKDNPELSQIFIGTEPLMGNQQWDLKAAMATLQSAERDLSMICGNEAPSCIQNMTQSWRKKDLFPCTHLKNMQVWHKRQPAAPRSQTLNIQITCCINSTFKKKSLLMIVWWLIPPDVLQVPLPKYWGFAAFLCFLSF